MNYLGKFVLVRTEKAGVNCGYLKEITINEICWCVLTESRKIWRWRGANTLHELSTKGSHLTEFTRISEPVDECCLINVIEIIEVKDKKVEENLTNSRWFND